MADMVRLKNAAGMFIDTAPRFTIKLDQEKPLPEPPGDLTRQWLNAGGLVYCGPAIPPVEPEEVAATEEIPDTPVEDAGSEIEELDLAARVKNLVMHNNLDELRRMCFEANIRFDKRYGAKRLAELLLERQ